MKNGIDGAFFLRVWGFLVPAGDEGGWGRGRKKPTKKWLKVVGRK